MRFMEPIELRLTAGDVHVLLDALMSYVELDEAMVAGKVEPPLRAINQPAATRSNLRELYGRIAAQLGDERRDARYPRSI